MSNLDIDVENLYDEDGYDKNGFNKEGFHKMTGTKYDENNIDKNGNIRDENEDIFNIQQAQQMENEEIEKENIKLTNEVKIKN